MNEQEIRAARRDLERASKRLAREEREARVPASVRCPEHGVSYACPGATALTSIYPHGNTGERVSCAHIACKHITNGRCPECEAA